MNWTDEENKVLLDAIERCINKSHVIEVVASGTGRTEASILRRLYKIGYLRSCGQTFSKKQGHV